mgnify:CR=1 FL=1|jgi:cbb3-type cytochrome oxidase maturation protein
MSVLYLVLPLALIIGAVAVGAFIWMVRGGQLDDLESPAVRMLHDDADASEGAPPSKDEAQAPLRED